ncbi:hypothetical protein [Shewanella sp. GutDb-MelDb]|uniref:hypothetical protein n=1 Tax=Shewanella sp. GutDb-MelDb TaxID=2058316 RepID=UPI000C79EECE|nr:hypothetical protein [Shewanella sp. GutDb-MelDb]PKG58197.1 hypothetical protein CXF82_05770 [Shewanella sp. GutDb-MelDb]
MKPVSRSSAPVFTALAAENGKGQPLLSLSVSTEEASATLAVIRADKQFELPVSHPLVKPMFGINTAAELTSIAEVVVEADNRDKGGVKRSSCLRSFQLFQSFIWVILLHIVLIGIINQLWVRQTLKVTTVAPIKIQSYLYVEAKPVKDEVMDSIDSSTSKVRSPRHSPTDSDNPSEADELVETSPVHEPAMEADNTIEAILPTTDLSEKTDIRINKSLPTYVPRRSAMAIAQSYLQRKNDAALDALIVDKANKYSGPHSLSKMDGDMVELVFPEVDEYSKIPTTDHRLDPNRIVRHGDTCFRIVQVPTQINPYAENIGYPFNCGGDKVKKAINDAISARLEKRMISRK